MPLLPSPQRNALYLCNKALAEVLDKGKLRPLWGSLWSDYSWSSLFGHSSLLRKYNWQPVSFENCQVYSFSDSLFLCGHYQPINLRINWINPPYPFLARTPNSFCIRDKCAGRSGWCIFIIVYWKNHIHSCFCQAIMQKTRRWSQNQIASQRQTQTTRLVRVVRDECGLAIGLCASKFLPVGPVGGSSNMSMHQLRGYTARVLLLFQRNEPWVVICLRRLGPFWSPGCQSLRMAPVRSRRRRDPKLPAPKPAPKAAPAAALPRECEGWELKS